LATSLAGLLKLLSRSIEAYLVDAKVRDVSQSFHSWYQANSPLRDPQQTWLYYRVESTRRTPITNRSLMSNERLLVMNDERGTFARYTVYRASSPIKASTGP